MSMDDDDVLAARRPLDRETLARISPLPPPEEVFFDWLMSVPHGACLEEAARCEIARIDRRGLSHPGVQRLRVLLASVAGMTGWHRPVANL
jgi:hypothetical protein